MKIGLVLSGGGARGIVHLGVIKALEEYHIKFDRISATSAGAIIGALYSYGYGPEEILRIILKTSFFKSLRPAWRKTGLLSLERLREVMITYLPQNDFNALKIPVTIAATDLQRGKTDYFTSGELLPAILASSCVPAMFDPVRIGAGLYVDGGILDNLPVKPIYDDSDFIVASYCNYVNPDFQVRNIRSVLERSLLMAVGANTILSRNMCDVLIEPPDAGRYSAFELNRAEDLFGIGYTFTKANFTAKDFPPHAKPSI